MSAGAGLSALPAELSAVTLGVIGDCVLDRYIEARPTRLSREAPVPVLSEQSRRESPGGAGNVACNLRALGANVELFAHIGADVEGRELLRLLESDGVHCGGVHPLGGIATPLKTRVLAGETHRTPMHVLRLDREPQCPPDALAHAALMRRALERAAALDALLVSDYGYGVGAAPLDDLIERLPTTVLDPRWPSEPRRGLTAITPNLEDFARYAGSPLDRLGTLGDLVGPAAEVRALFDADWLLITLGNRGMALFGGDGQAWHVPAAGKPNIVDVCGAGDTALSVFTLALATGRSAPDAMALANAAAGVVVLESGAAVCTNAALSAALRFAPRARRLDAGSDVALPRADVPVRDALSSQPSSSR